MAAEDVRASQPITPEMEEIIRILLPADSVYTPGKTYRGVQDGLTVVVDSSVALNRFRHGVAVRFRSGGQPCADGLSLTLASVNQYGEPISPTKIVVNGEAAFPRLSSDPFHIFPTPRI